MSNTYRPVSDRAKALEGDKPFEADYTPGEERDQLDGGHLEIVPRPYKVLVNNFAAGEQGDTVDLALLVEEEGALLAGGILERSDPPKKTAKKAGK
jgi:hypothetical protein